MRKHIVLIITALAAFGAAASFTASASARIIECGDAGGGYVNLTTRNVACSPARRLAIAIENKRLIWVRPWRNYHGRLLVLR